MSINIKILYQDGVEKNIVVRPGPLAGKLDLESSMFRNRGSWPRPHEYFIHTWELDDKLLVKHSRNRYKFQEEVEWIRALLTKSHKSIKSVLRDRPLQPTGIEIPECGLGHPKVQSSSCAQ